MSGNCFGSRFKISTFGESRGNAVGVVIDGCPSGIEILSDEIQHEINCRKPLYDFETSRREDDVCEILSGVFEDKSLGTPITIIVRNAERSQKDYVKLKDVFRPGHADYGWHKKFQHRDFRGGGRSSGRETVARVAGGAVAKKILRGFDINIQAKPVEIYGIPVDFNSEVFPDDIINILQESKASGNSVGGIVECRITGVKAGIGEPVFSKLDAELAKAIISIGGIKGIEFGAGFDFSKIDGFTSNDIYKNNNGGIIGGISDGNDIVFRCVVKPTPSISICQPAYNVDGDVIQLKIDGRHDVCIVRRVFSVIEAMSAIVIANFML